MNSFILSFGSLFIADIVIMESTYGNRIHPPASSGIKELAEAIKKTVRRGGTAVIPTFAVGRTQEIIYDINQLLLGDKEFAAAMKNEEIRMMGAKLPG